MLHVLSKRIKGIALSRVFLATMLLVPLAGSQTAGADPAITEYPLPTSTLPVEITQGSDGATWFTASQANAIERIDTSGSVTKYTIPTGNATPHGITSGPDGALWFAEHGRNKIGRVTTSGTFTEYSLPTTPYTADPYGITTGPDGNLWYVGYNFAPTVGGTLGRITPSGTITQWSTGTHMGVGITTGSDGALWFTATDNSANTVDYIGRATTTGTISYYPLPGNQPSPQSITTGPDGNVWFTERSGNAVGSITPAGVITEYSTSSVGVSPHGITVGPDGALWFSSVSGKIGRITTSGNITGYTVPGTNPQPYDIASGPDGGLWFTDESNSGHAIGHVTLPPAAPTDLAAASPTKTPVLNWPAVSGADHYNVYRNGGTTPITTTTAPTYTDTTAQPDGSYSYYVTALKDGAESTPSNTITVVVDTTRPAVTVTPVAGSALQGTTTFTITVSDDNPLDPSKNTSVWVYMYNTTGTPKSWGAKVDLSSGTGTFIIDTTKLNNGLANLDVGLVYDAAGNASGTTDNYFRDYIIAN